MNTAFGLLAESGNVIERIQGLGSADKQLADPDYWSTVGIVTVTGILVVFLILIILIVFFMLMGAAFKAAAKSRAAKKEAQKQNEAPAAASAPVVEETATEEEEIDNDDEIIAVISAAIAAYTDGESYTIKSVTRHTDRRTRSAWSMAGIGSNMRQF